MPQAFALPLSWLILAYLAIGVVFAIPFAFRGAKAIDSAAKEATWGFKLLVIPGAVMLWPFLLKRWASGLADPPEEKNAHRNAACALHQKLRENQS
ncbi:MAG: hypothetical protein ACRBF0_14105 [Calditrichia bacterium]